MLLSTSKLALYRIHSMSTTTTTKKQRQKRWPHDETGALIILILDNRSKYIKYNESYLKFVNQLHRPILSRQLYSTNGNFEGKPTTASAVSREPSSYCVKEIKEWSTINGLKLNDQKTEILHFSSRFRRRIQLPIVTIDNTPIVPKAPQPGI